MTRTVFRAEPTRVASFAPGRRHAILSRPGHVSRRAEPREVLAVNNAEFAPVEKLDNQRFLETMKAKGWLR